MPPIKIINAGAGSGKTYQLTKEVFRAIKEDSVAPAKILLTTFTNKAAAELRIRVSEKLLQEGMDEEAMLLRSARIGTVHSICSSLLDEHAFEAGLTVRHKVLPQSEIKPLFDETLATAVPKNITKEIQHLSYRFYIEDWRTSVEAIVEKARSNLITANELPIFADKSLQILFENIGNSNSQKENLIPEINKAISSLKELPNPNGQTKKAINALISFKKESRSGNPRWSQYLKMACLKPAVDLIHLVENVQILSVRHFEWPEFRSDMHQLLNLIFQAAKLTLDAYQIRKEEMGYLDFVDLEQLGLSLLNKPKIRTALGQNLDLVMVDEFQDTSPIQLQLFFKTIRAG